MKHLFLVMMVGVLVGCGKKEKEEPQVQTETLKFPGNLIWKFEAGIMSSSPTIGSDGTVYIRSNDSKLYAINGKTGVKLWEFEIGDLVRSSPAIGSDGTVYVGSGDKKLYAIKTDSKGLAKSPCRCAGKIPNIPAARQSSKNLKPRFPPPPCRAHR